MSTGCSRCYAMGLAARFSKHGQWGRGFAEMRSGRPHWTDKVSLIPEKLAEPLRLRKPAVIFVNSTSDLYHEDLPLEDIAAVFGVMAAAPQHRFQVLTKRPERMAEFFSWLEGFTSSPPGQPATGTGWCRPLAVLVAALDRSSIDLESPLEFLPDYPWPLPNVDLGTSCEDQQTFDERWPVLAQCPAARRFISWEPLLTAIDAREALNGYPQQVSSAQYVSREMALDAGAPELEGSLYGDEKWEQTMPRPDYAVAGGESGSDARPCDLAWLRDLGQQCEEAGVPFQVKQLGSFPVVQKEVGTGKGGCAVPLNLRSSHGTDPAGWPEDLRRWAGRIATIE